MCNSINVDSLIFPSGDDEDPDAMSDNKVLDFCDCVLALSTWGICTDYVRSSLLPFDC